MIMIYSLVQYKRCRGAVNRSYQKLDEYNAKTIRLSYGDMTFTEQGEGEIILSVHGIFGGYDQALETCREFISDFRIIAPSRFGYLGSDIRNDGTPAEQAAAYVELLDKLGIDQVYVLGTSAGGSAAIRFALDFPDRTKGLILYCSAMPLTQKPEKYAQYAGPPAWVCNDFAMFMLSPLFKYIMGMAPSTIHSMLPVGKRKTGIILDGAKTNPDMARNYDEYNIEDLSVPTIILHAKDDKLAHYAGVEKGSARFLDCTLISFETGGHLMVNHSREIQAAVKKFIDKP